MGYAQLPADLAEIPRNIALVVHDRGAADHLQIRDPREMAQDLVLHAVREKGILLVAAQVNEGQNCNASLRRTRLGGTGFRAPRQQPCCEKASDYGNASRGDPAFAEPAPC